MKKPLRVLLIEDSDDDAQMILRELRRSNYEITFERVETREQMLMALEKQTFGLAVSNFAMPHFYATGALELIKAFKLDLPLIIVTGSVGEEAVINCLLAGAKDYILKSNLSRLIPAIERELGQAEIRKQARQAEEELKKTNSELRAIFEAFPDLLFRLNPEGIILDYKAGRESDLYVPPKVFLHKKVQDVLPPEVGEQVKNAISQVIQARVPVTIEYSLPMKEGLRYFEARLLSLENEQIIVVIRNVTERKKMEEQLNEKLEELKFINDAAVGRELRMADLEKEVNALLAEKGHPPKY